MPQVFADETDQTSERAWWVGFWLCKSARVVSTLGLASLCSADACICWVGLIWTMGQLNRDCVSQKKYGSVFFWRLHPQNPTELQLLISPGFH